MHSQHHKLIKSAQNDVISTLTALNEKLQAKVQVLEKSLKEATSPPAAGGVFDAAKSAGVKADPKEIKALKAELAKAQEMVQEKEVKCKPFAPYEAV
jgi:hypothetical protein